MKSGLSCLARVTKHLLLVFLVLCSFGRTYSQTATYKYDIGAQLGMSGYIGEANSSNIFKHPGFDGELSFRYIGDARWAIRGLFSTFGLSGNTAGMENILPNNAEYSFSSQVYSLGARGEFNFLPYGIGETYKRLRRWTPYVTLGVGLAMAPTGGRTFAAPTLPMGFGFKYKISERWNLGVEFTMTKAFNDHFDSADLNDPF